MSSSDSDRDEILTAPRNRRKGEQQKTPVKLRRKKPRESPLLEENGVKQGGKRVMTKTQNRIVESDEDDSSFEASDVEEGSPSPTSVENHPPRRGKNKESAVVADTSFKCVVNLGAKVTPVGGPSNAKVNVPRFQENDDEAEKRQRQRKRLSKSLQSGSDAVGDRRNSSGVLNQSTTTSGPLITDRKTLRDIYSTCIQLFQAHKITEQNAFSLKLLECLDEIINGPDFDKNDMHMVGRTLEVGTRIYVCRVDHTHTAVMHLASEIGLRKKQINSKGKKKQSQVDGEEDDEEVVGEENFDREEERKKPRKKKKRSRFIEEDDAKLTTDFEDQSTKYVARRTALKKKFTRMIDEELDFDYVSCFMTSETAHPLKTAEEYNAYTEPTDIPESHINSDDLKHVRFLPFNLLSNFDSSIFNVWGMPLSGTDSAEDARDEIAACQQPELPPANPEYLYDPGTRPEEYPEEVYEGMEFNDSMALQQDGASQQPADSTIPAMRIQNIRSLDQLSQYFTAVKNVHKVSKDRYGWAGPNFYRPHRNIQFTEANRKPKQRKKKEPVFIQFVNVNWQDDWNRYMTNNPERTVLDERTIQKWSYTKTSIPYLGIEGDADGEDDDEDYDEGFEFEDEDDPGFIPPLLRYFVDPNRNIIEQLEKEIKEYGDIRDASQFTNNDGEYPDDSFIPEEGFEVEALRELEQDYCGSNGLLNGEDNEHQPDREPASNGIESLISLFPGSMGMNNEDDLMSKATEATDSIKFAKKPKPIDIHALKTTILKILTQKLHMAPNGGPTKDEDSTTDMLTLLQEVRLRVDKKTLEHLSISIVVVALMHIVAENGLFMDSGNMGDLENPLIICHGKLWDHKSHIPMATFEKDKHLHYGASAGRE